MDTLGLKNTPENQKKVRDPQAELPGPIQFGAKGQQPRVDKSELLEWWERCRETLFARADEAGRAIESDRLTVEPTYQHGRGATVVPDINGHVGKARGRPHH